MTFHAPHVVNNYSTHSAADILLQRLINWLLLVLWIHSLKTVIRLVTVIMSGFEKNESYPHITLHFIFKSYSEVPTEWKMDFLSSINTIYFLPCAINIVNQFQWYWNNCQNVSWLILDPVMETTSAILLIITSDLIRPTYNYTKSTVGDIIALREIPTMSKHWR